jgi:hypothetical protein
MNYHCESCQFHCFKKSDWTRHVSTVKHITKKSPTNLFTSSPFECLCGKKYKHKSTLSTHKKKCQISSLPIAVVGSEPESMTDKKIIIELLKQNNELHTRLMEMNQNSTHVTTISQKTTNITQNNTFNLNFFLNETCKNAMNMADFIASIELQLKDLMRVGKVGYVRGISDIIITNLEKLDITERPLHCSDVKRETMYIKDNNIWGKDNEQKERLRRVVKEISMLNSRTLPLYKEKYPDVLKHDFKYGDEYDKIVIESLGGINMDVRPNQNKIMRNLARVTAIDKHLFI